MLAILAIGGLAFWLGMTVLLLHFIVGPIDRAARNLRAPRQFSLVDFLSLIFLVQLPTGLVRYFVGNGQGQGIAPPVLYGFGWLATGLLWYVGVRTLSAAAIVNPWHRILFFCFIGPVSLTAIWVLPLTVFAAADAIVNHDHADLPLPLAIAMLTNAAIALAGWLSRYIVRSRELEPVEVVD